MSVLIGADQLRARLHAVGHIGVPVSKSVGAEMLSQARKRISVKTGRTRSTLHLGTVNEKGAKLLGSKVAVILDKGAREHDIEPRERSVLVFEGRTGTVFTKKVHKPRQAGTQYLRKSMQEAAHKASTEPIVTAWNSAA